MRLGLVPENPIEWLVARLGLVPRPVIETQIAYTLARVIMVGSRLGVFDELAKGAVAVPELAERLGTDPRATGKLLFALAGVGYLKAENGCYALTPVSRKWLICQSKYSLADKLDLQFLEWDWMEQSEEFVRTGQPVHMHEVLDSQGWDRYQRGMRAVAGGPIKEIIIRMPVPRGARDMLDIGGSHGYHSVALCRRHRGLRSVIIDLPDAVEKAAPLLAAEGMGDRVVHRAGNALTDELGVEVYDLVIIVSVIHHFSEDENIALAHRIARALRPGGAYAVVDAFRASSPREAGQVPALLDFYFALTSESGTWPLEQIAEWQQAAGLKVRRPILLRTLPGFGIQVAEKS